MEAGSEAIAAAEQWFMTAVGHHQAGRLDQAEAAYAAVLQAVPAHAPTLVNLALLQQAVGRAEAALATLRRLTALRPDHPDGWFNLATLLPPGEAAAALDRALALRPHWPQALANRANARRRLGRLDEAEADLHAALAQAADQPDLVPVLHKDLANLLADRGRLDEAAARLDAALAARPDFAEAQNNRGTVLLLAHCQAAADGGTDPGRLEAALDRFAAAARLRPDWAEPAVSHASTLLLAGRWREGWPGYERRSGIRPPEAPAWAAALPRWQGEPLAGRTLLAIGEAGLGDMLQAARYLVRAARDGARVLVTAPAPLQRLFQRLPGVAGVLGQGDPLPPFDLWTTTGSLAAGFADDLAGIPAEVPYVAPDPALVAAWGARLAAAGPARRRIGIAWAGGRRDHIPGSVLFNSHRSLPLGALAPLWQQPGTAVWALQQGPALSEGDGIAAVRRPDIGDMADTAAIMAHLDLVVTVDTSVAHLAGATGRPVLVMLHATHCERWMVDRPDSPWYPTMRLIRQPTLGDWPPVVEAVVRAVSGQ